jgi:iron uptake system EfeUOB component EfeO/EfeM
VQLKGDVTAEQASEQRSTTEQLAAATEENLKKVAERQLGSSQQEVVNQIKDFLEQSKKAITAGDLERGRNLAMKARLLSDELLKP